MRVLAEGPMKITKATIDAAWRRRKANHRLIVRDKDCRGLSLIVNQTTMAWSFAYRPRGIDPLTGRRRPNRTVTLGNPATHSPAKSAMHIFLKRPYRAIQCKNARWTNFWLCLAADQNC